MFPFKNLDSAYHALGGMYLYSQALSFGIGIPRVMLNANDAFLYGCESDYISILVDELAKQQWEAFRNPCFEPNEAFEKCYIKILCKHDKGWSQFKNKLRKTKGLGLRSLMSTNPKGFRLLPKQAQDELITAGWEYMTQSQRVVFRKEISCLKVVLDVDGLEQNYNEYLFLVKYGGKSYSLTTSIGNINVKVPELYARHPRYLWITREWVNGDKANFSPEGFNEVREAIMREFSLQDVRAENLIWDKELSCYWIIDPGIPLQKTY